MEFNFQINNLNNSKHIAKNIFGDNISENIFNRRIKFMSSTTFTRGLGIVMAVGSMAVMAGSSMAKGSHKRKAKRTVNKAINTVSDIFDNVQDIIP